jgi:hypothetical protein
MNIFDTIAENKIQEAMKRGEFDNLPLHGIPIHVDDDFSISAERRFILKHLLAYQQSRGKEPSPLVLRWKALRRKNGVIFARQ